MTGEPAIDEDRLAEAALALMSLTPHDGERLWTQYAWSVTDRRFDLGFRCRAISCEARSTSSSMLSVVRNASPATRRDVGASTHQPG